jgi:hypothetical protein
MEPEGFLMFIMDTGLCPEPELSDTHAKQYFAKIHCNRIYYPPI